MLGLAGFGLLLRTAIAVLTTTVRVIPAVIRIIVTTTAKLTTATVAATSTSTSISTTKTSCTSPAISWGCPKHGLCMELSPARIPLEFRSSRRGWALPLTLPQTFLVESHIFACYPFRPPLPHHPRQFFNRNTPQAVSGPAAGQ